jgi:hypothetical protein
MMRVLDSDATTCMASLRQFMQRTSTARPHHGTLGQKATRWLSSM